MEADIGDTIEPLLTLRIEIGIMQKAAAVHEIAAQIPNGSLDFALGLCTIRAAGARREAPVVRETEKLHVTNQCAAFQPQVARDDGLHLVEEQLVGDASKAAKRVLQAVIECRHVLAPIEATPQQARIAEDHE